MNAVWRAEYKDFVSLVMNGEYMTVLLSSLRDTGSHKEVKGDRHEPLPPHRPDRQGRPKFPEVAL